MARIVLVFGHPSQDSLSAAIRDRAATSPRGATLAWSVATGAIGICALASMQLALRDGDSGVVSVAASQFGTAAVILSVAFNGERMRWWQALGVAATALGVALLSLG